MKLVQITYEAFEAVLPFKREGYSIKRLVSEAIEEKYLQTTMAIGKKYTKPPVGNVGVYST